MQAIYRGYLGTYNNANGDSKEEHIILLTDRAIYRPGQTVYIKGIAVTMGLDSAHVLANRSYEMVARDANQQVLVKKAVRTNEFGSFTTDFVLPPVCLNGTFRIQVSKQSCTFRVEEYKRPTFDITFEKQAKSYKLGDNIQVKGAAMSYSGVPLSDRQVTYTVTRIKHCWWSDNSSEEIASGKVETDANGLFAIPFKLQSDEEKQEDEEEMIYYDYRVTATVTNVAGETESSVTSLSAGNRSLILELQIENRLCKDNPIVATMDVHNLDGVAMTENVAYSLYKVLDGKKASAATFSGQFQSNCKETCDWRHLPSGSYWLEASVKDKEGREVKNEKKIVLFSMSDKRPAEVSPLWYYAENTAFDSAHPADFCFGTSEKDAYILMNVCAKNQILESRTFVLSDSIVRFNYPYRDSYGDGLAINFCFVKDGNVYQQQVTLEKHQPVQKLILKWDVFRDKLRPGQKEEWKLTVKTPQGKPVDAEMLALMYDASLDKIWKNAPNFALSYRRNIPYFRWNYRSADWQWYACTWNYK
jgi:hypothetical protein